MGRKVTTLDLGHNPDIKQPYLDALTFCLPIDAIWCCHVLEHQTDPGRFLRKMYRDLPTGGVLAITVPPAKHDIVGGHVTIWNAGLLLYQLILAGFDCSAARVGTYGYNISIIVEKRPAQLPELTYDTGDIERLAPFFPFAARHGFNGQVANIAW
jgi:SAM-dependent methyltransferase